MRYFFVVALGRSGTSFLAGLLSRAPDAIVNHEPYPLDPHLLSLRYAGFDAVADQLLEKRFLEILPPTDSTTKCYGEVNSYLRYEVDWLQRRFDPQLIHLVRDGRDYVRSAFTRDIYTAGDRQIPIVPVDRDPYAAKWSSMSRFEQLCWLWCHSNDFLADRVANIVRFEDILSNYGILKERILEPIGLQIDETVWRHMVSSPKNTSQQSRRRRFVRMLLLRRKPKDFLKPIPHWSKWSAWQTERFWDICGETMERLGYNR